VQLLHRLAADTADGDLAVLTLGTGDLGLGVFALDTDLVFRGGELARDLTNAQYAIVYSAVFLTAIGCYVTLLVSEMAGKRLSQTGLNVLHRVMGVRFVSCGASISRG